MNRITLCAAAVAAFHALPAGAVTITTIGADFSTPVGGSNITYANNDGVAGNEVFRWGAPTVASNNSFTFASTAVPLTVATDTQFSLGTFTFQNEATQGTALTSLRLALTTAITGSATPVTFLFTLGVTQTPNTAPCQFPSVVPCSDRVTITALSNNGSFVANGTPYTLVIDGFRNAAGAFSTEFYGEEEQATGAEVIGRFTTVAAATTSLPEPGSWAMLIAGFGLVGAGMRRPRRVSMRFA